MERAALCSQYLLEDITGDEVGQGTPARIRRPVARVFFCRGQEPCLAGPGDEVTNDLDGVLRVVQEGWSTEPGRRTVWALVLLDLAFRTGRVTPENDRAMTGMPPEQAEDSERLFGLRILQALQHKFPDLPVVILSSQPRERVSREFAALGALAFVARSDNAVPETLQDLIWRHGLVPDFANKIVGRSRALLFALRAARRAGLDRRNVLIRGERGTGKELLARFLHDQGTQKATRPFVVVDSGSLSPSLFQSELFGHRRGSFTGAAKDRIGRIVQASGGDLFLDEIANAPVDVQAGLLRVIEYRTVTPVGAFQGQSVDVRFISATHEDLDRASGSLSFRPDLLDRLREGGTIVLPPLRERLEDLDELVGFFVREAENSVPGAMWREVEPEALETLAQHDWPGNLRELRACIHAAVLNHPDVEHLVPAHIAIRSPANRSVSLETAGPPLLWSSEDRSTAPSTTALLPAEELIGTLPVIQREQARAIARILRSALIWTRRVTAEEPDGKLLIHPAVKLITGDSSISASKAADVIKRLLTAGSKADPSLLSDPVLQQALDIALKLRPRKPSKRSSAP